MTDIVLKDIDPVLHERIQRIAQARGWSLPEALFHLLEHGLFACESTGGASDLDHRESNALEEAIAALQGVPDDPGFSLIGRMPPAAPAE